VNSQAELVIANDLYKQGKNAQALSLLDDIKSQYQDDYKYFLLRGLVEAAQNDHEVSVKSFIEAIKLEPLDPMAYANIGDALAKNLQHDEADKYFKLALQLEPNFMEAICGLGVVAFQRCDYEACEAYFLRALGLRPNHEIVLANIGNCYSVQGKYREALRALDKAISLDPKNSLARTNRALIRLGAGKFEKGWADYEYRWDSGNFLANRFQDIPRWPGPTGEAANVLIWAEQGLGDEVMFASIFRELESRPERFFIECDKRLFNIFRASFPRLNFIPKSLVKNTGPIKYQLPLASLGRYFRRTPKSFDVSRDGYLECSGQGLKDETLAALEKLPRPWIGVSWESYALTKNFRARKSISAVEFSELTRDFSASFINLQFSNPHKHERKYSIEQNVPENVVTLPDIDLKNDIEALVALISKLDGVVTIGNTVAHICGAFGVKAEVLLPSVPDWRWGHDGFRSVWYSSLTFTRNDSAESWAAPLAGLRERLARDFAESIAHIS